MNISNIKNNMSRSLYKAKFKLQQHAPEIMVVGGIIGGVVSTVMACKATTKVNFILEETQKKIDIVHEGIETGEVQGYLDNGEVGMVSYSAEDGNKDLAIVYGKAGIELVKLYAPAVAVGCLSITSILGGYRIMHKRNVALAVAYTALDNSFKGYKNRVIERFGEAMDRELTYGIKAVEIEETTVDKKGKEKTVTKTIEVMDPNNVYSPYAFCFDESCVGWERDAELNKFFLLQQQNYANDKLKAQGYLFLNDVRKMLGALPTAAGQECGWIYNSEKGDGCVDFGIFDIHKPVNREFVNGYEKSIWIDPNVDGYILDKLKDLKF